MVDSRWLLRNCGFGFGCEPKLSGDKHGQLCKTCVWRIIVINLIGLLLAAVWFRCCLLGNIPGLNGDEAWYGARAIDMLRGTPVPWQTPTGNPLSPLFIGPVIALNWWFWPSVVLLRSVAVAGGLTALVLNWILCRWVYDRRLAGISTAVLAILPINIAYSRFAWDASQSLAATLPVVYFSLAAIRFPQGKGRLIAAAAACQVIAVLVHPTNIIVSTVILAALAAQGKPGDIGAMIRRLSRHPFVVAAVLAACLLIGLWIVWLIYMPMLHRIDAHLRESSSANSMFNASILYPRLFTGGTIYRYIAGSDSWFHWPIASDCEGYGVDVLVFWLLILAAGIILWRSWKSAGREEDGVLIAAWTLALAAFLSLAGPRAMSPGQERFAICLVALTVVFLCRAGSIVLRGESWTSRGGLIVAVAAGWLVLADFNAHYFRFIETTGGEAKPTFRTAAVEPKTAALKYILEHRSAGETWIVASEWWNYWPLKYLGAAQSDLHVFRLEEAAKEAETFAAEKYAGRTWFVEFTGSAGLRKIETQLAERDLTRQEIKDYAGRPILTVLHVK